MSSAFPLITEWIKNGEDWLYIHESTIKPIVLSPGQELDVPYARKIYEYPEMVVSAVVTVFDNPLCGVRLRWEPGYDSKNDFTVFNVALGSAISDPLVYARIPPATPPGIYILHIPSFWVGMTSLQFSVFNSDSAPHYFLGHGYIIAANTKKKRRA